MVNGTSATVQEHPVKISAMVFPCLCLPKMLFNVLAHTALNGEKFSNIAIRVQPWQHESPSVKQLPAGSRVFSSVI